jgi:hypothetical protein
MGGLAAMVEKEDYRWAKRDLLREQGLTAARAVIHYSGGGELECVSRPCLGEADGA